MSGLYLKHENSNDTVILFHGWTGETENVKPLAEAIYKNLNVNVSCPTLTGHGEWDKERFIKATYKDWLTDAERSVIIEKEKGNNVIAIGGLSMGAMLAVNTAIKYSIDKVILISPAYYNRDWRIMLAPILSLCIKSWPLKKHTVFMPYSEFESDEYVQQQKLVYKRHIWVKPAAELLRLQKYSRKLISNYREKSIIIYSEQDEAVGHKSFMYTIKKLNPDIFITEIGNHEILNDVRVNSAVIAHILDWLQDKF